MPRSTVLTSDDERLAFAKELGWLPDAHATGDAYEREAATYFDLETLVDRGYHDVLEGVDQRQLDEVRDAVVRRAPV